MAILNSTLFKRSKGLSLLKTILFDFPNQPDQKLVLSAKKTVFYFLMKTFTSLARRFSTECEELDREIGKLLLTNIHELTCLKQELQNLFLHEKDVLTNLFQSLQALINENVFLSLHLFY